MAPNTKERSRVGKKYLYVEPVKYKVWEKQRRARFNDKLEELASILPKYDASSPWKKAEIIENAIAYIRSQNKINNKVLEESMRTLTKENLEIKHMLWEELGLDPQQPIDHLTCKDIKIFLKCNKQTVENQQEEGDTHEDLAFLAKIAQSNDHCYSLTVQDEPSVEIETEVIEMMAEETDSAVLCKENTVPTIIEAISLNNPIIATNRQTFDPTIPIVISGNPCNTLLGQTGIIMNLEVVPAMSKLPIPRLTSNLTTVTVNRGSKSCVLQSGKNNKSSKKIDKKENSSGKSAKTLEKKISSNIKKVVQEESIHKEEVSVATEPLNESVVEEQVKLDEVTEQEKEELVLGTKTEETQISIKEGSKEKRKKTDPKKKSKSSYSIAALCQISVNIGDRPEMANSPGVYSLNSMGTISPSNTPAPTPPIFRNEEIETCSIVIDPHSTAEDPVIEELKTIRPEDVSLMAADKITTSNANIYINTLPAVSKQDKPETSSSTGSKFPSMTASSKIIQKEITQALKALDSQLINAPITTHQRPEKVDYTQDKTDISHTLPHSQKQAAVQTNLVKNKGENLASCEGMNRIVSGKETHEKKKEKTELASNPLGVYEFSVAKTDSISPLKTQKPRQKDSKTVKYGDKNKDSLPKPRTSQNEWEPNLHEKSKITCTVAKTSKSTADFKTKVAETRKQTVPPNNSNITPNYGHSNIDHLAKQSNDEAFNPRSRRQAPDVAINRSIQEMGEGSVNIETPTTYISGAAHQTARQTYMSSHYHYQPIPINQHFQPYHLTASVPVTASQNFISNSYSLGGHENYAPANMQDFNPNPPYYTNPKPYISNNSHYRNFRPSEETHPNQRQNCANEGKRSGIQLHQGNQMGRPNSDNSHDPNSNQNSSTVLGSVPINATNPTIPTSINTFSVNQLVNSSQQRKGSKRSNNSSSKSNNKQLKTDHKDDPFTEKEETRKGKSSSSRRGKSGTRSNYSAESLISVQGHQMLSENKQDVKQSDNQSKTNYNKTNEDKNASSSGRMNINWQNESNQHFTGLQLSSLSPSPANLFSSDLSVLDFPMSIFGSQDIGNNQNLQTLPDKVTMKEFLPTSSSNAQQGKSSKLSGTCNHLPASRAAVPDWSLMDNSLFPPLPTLTPPSEDPMAYSFMAPISHSGFYPGSGVSSQPAPRPHNQVYSTHSAANMIPTPHTNVITKGGATGHQVFQPSQSMTFPTLASGSNSQTGSLVNFNLSTIFPEINIPPSIQQNCQSKAAAAPHISSLPPADFLQNSRSAQLATPELLTHSITLLGHSSHQVMPSFSVGTNMVPGLSFSNLHEQ